MGSTVDQPPAERAARAVGFVVVGRNEGERLRNCLRSIEGAAAVVYVDSGSTDDSVRDARLAGCEVVELDMRLPFTAARARNAGLDRLCSLAPQLTYVQFVDGDSEIVAGWTGAAVAFLETHSQVAVVSGRLRERYPDRSIYNWLCDLEWNAPVGETKACGGNALFRMEPLLQVGAFRADLIAGEEPELCVRLRAAGWRIWRLDTEMALHDAAMTRFGQWWRRAVRGGFAMAQGVYLHGDSPARHKVWEARRAWLWGLWLPIACLLCGLLFGPWGWVMWLIYPLQVARQSLRNRGTASQRMLQALFQMLARFAETWGQIRFLRDRLTGRQTRLLEYK